jgi:hypothetical protein
VITLFVILIVKHWGEFKIGDMVMRFVLPMCGLMVLIWLNYWFRRHASADLARRHYQWMSRVHGYTAAAAEFGRDRNYDLDQECTDFWRTLWSLRVREFHEYFWGVNSGNVFHFGALAVAVPMIYLAGTRVMNSQIEIGVFVTVMTAYFVVIDALNDIMDLLMKLSLGYEGVQRIAQVFNGSELKSAYQDPLTGLTMQGGVFLRELDLARLIRIDPAKLRTIDLRRIRRMNLDDLAAIEVQRLETMGVDLPTLIKVSQLTEIVEQFQMDQHKDNLPTYMDMIRHESDDDVCQKEAALDSTEPLLKESNATLQQKSVAAASSAMTLSPSPKQQQKDKRASKIGLIWPGGRPNPTPSFFLRAGQHSYIASASPYQSPHPSHPRARRGSASVPVAVTRRASLGPSGPTTSMPSHGLSPQGIIYDQNTCLGALSRRTTFFPGQETSEVSWRYSTEGKTTKGLGFRSTQNDNLTHPVHFHLAGLDDDVENIDSDNLVGDDADLISEVSDKDDNASFFKVEDLEREAEMLLEESIAEVGVQRAFSRLKYVFLLKFVC